MSEICVFAGTSEGRRLLEFLGGQDLRALACVATEYGEALVPRADNIEVSTGRLDGDAMQKLFAERGFDLVIDATHPYLQFAHENSGGAEILLVEVAEGMIPEIWRLEEGRQPALRLKTTEVKVNGRRCVRAAIDADGRQHRYVVFDTSDLTPYQAPTVVGDVPNQNLHAVDSLDMVIITPASGIFDAQAERLAAVHRELDSLRIGVFRADQIYNEFSSGTPDATAYRRFLKMLYDRGLAHGLAPRYLLLFGDCAWDNRMLTATWRTSDPNDFLLCFESEKSLNDMECYVMEDYFGLLDDGEGANLKRDRATSVSDVSPCAP